MESQQSENKLKGCRYDCWKHTINTFNFLWMLVRSNLKTAIFRKNIYIYDYPTPPLFIFYICLKTACTRTERSNFFTCSSSLLNTSYPYVQVYIKTKPIFLHENSCSYCTKALLRIEEKLNSEENLGFCVFRYFIYFVFSTFFVISSYFVIFREIIPGIELILN